MRVPELVSPSPQQLLTQAPLPPVLPVRAPLLATPPATTLIMSNTSSNTSGISTGSATSQVPQLSEQMIFAPGALVEVQTVRQETITGEVLAFEYDHKLLILKSESSNKQKNTSNVTCVNLNLCSKVNILAEPPHMDQLESEMEKLPEIDLKKLEERFRNAVQERNYMIDAYNSGAGIEGISLFSKLQKTFGENPGISWEHDSIIIGKHVRIGSPYRADCVSIRSVGSNTPPDKVAKTSLDFTKQVVEKYWRDQHKDPYTLSPLANNSAPVVVGTTPAVVAAASVVSPPPPTVLSQAPVVVPQSTPAVVVPPQLSQPNVKGQHHNHHPQQSQSQQQQHQHNRSNMNKNSSGGGGQQHNKSNQQQSNQQHHSHHHHGQQQHNNNQVHHREGSSSRNASVSSVGGVGGSAPSSGPSSVSSYASLASASLDHGGDSGPPTPTTTTNTTPNTKKSIAAVVAASTGPTATTGPTTVARS